MTTVLGIALAVFAAALLTYHIKTRRIMDALNRMLDEAIRGEFEAANYNETELSKIEAKLSRFLSESKLKKGQIENEQEKIHSLISDISHQTKTPIANVLLYAQLLDEQDGMPGGAKALTAQITAGTEKLNFLIQSLIKTSRLESGIIKVSPRKGDVRELIAAARGECMPKAHGKGIEMTFEPAAEPVFAMFDPKWCSEALYNILDNAIKYTDTGGQVDITVQPYEMFVRINIQDTGYGICEEDWPRVFGRFWRAKNSAAIEGVGIGLYLAREIVSVCGGYIKVSGAVGEGSVFSVFLPKG